MSRILVFGITDNPGGVESVIMNYYRSIDYKKIKFDFLCNTNTVAYENEIIELGGTIYRIPKRSKKILSYYKELKKFFKVNSKKYDAIWVNVCSLANIDYLIFAKKYGIKYRIIHCHNSQNMDSKIRKIIHKINKKILNIVATDYWTCSPKANTWFFSKKIIDSNKIVTINNAIDYDKYKFDENIREKYKKEFDIKDNEVVFGHIGRFHFQKNQLRLIEIFDQIHRKRKNTKLFLVGDGEDKDKIEKKIEEYGLKECIILLGIRSDIESLLQMFDAIIFPSLFEGLPLTLVEAQANGLPVFASNTIPDEVIMSNNIKLIPLEDTNEQWSKIILDSNLKRCDNYKLIVNKGYDINSEVKKIERLLKRK